MNRQIFVVGTVAIVLGGVLSACAGGETSESDMSGGNRPPAVSAPPMSGAGEPELGEVLVTDDFTVQVDSVEPFVDDYFQLDLQSGHADHDPLIYQINYTSTYTGTEPTTKRRIPVLVDETTIVTEGFSDRWNDEPFNPGDSFPSSWTTTNDLAKESHAFKVVIWDDASETFQTLGTITLGPDSLT